METRNKRYIRLRGKYKYIKILAKQYRKIFKSQQISTYQLSADSSMPANLSLKIEGEMKSFSDKNV